MSQRISDQFLLGSSLLVAPVLREGQRARDVYLPPTQQVGGTKSGNHEGAWEVDQQKTKTKMVCQSVSFWSKKTNNDQIPKNITNFIFGNEATKAALSNYSI